jgi:metallopeptidase MepB
MALEPYRKPPQEPLRWDYTPETLLHRVKTLCDQHNQKLRGQMVEIDPETATFDNFLLPIAHLENGRLSNQDFIHFYAQVSPNEIIRDALRKAEQILSAEKLKQPDISEWAKAIYDRGEELDLESQKFLNITKNDQTQTKETTTKDRIKAIDERIEEICVEFDANLHNEGGGFWASDAELMGVPIGILDELEKGTGDNEGKFHVVYKWTLGLPVIEYAMDPDVRKKLYLGRAQSVSSPSPLYFTVYHILLSLSPTSPRPH